MTIAAVHLDPTAPLVERIKEEFSPGHLQRIVKSGAELVPEHLWETALRGPLVNFLGRPGKEFRGRLVRFSWSVCGGKEPAPEELALIVEVLHAASLIVDDIEDGSAQRRGQPALHVLYGMPTALNAGNWLYFWAFALLTRAGLDPQRELVLHRTMTNTLLRCHQGQALDLNSHMARLAKRDVPNVVSTTTKLKTGCLMELAACIGALAAGATPRQVAALSRFGSQLGTCLQMLDDKGGLYSQRRCHKGHEDLLLGRPTWPWAWLAEELDELRFAQLQARAREVENGDLHPEALAEVIRDALGDRPTQRIHAELSCAVNELGHEFGQGPVNELRAEVARLERSYE